MKKKNYSIILCGGLFLASCMSNNDKCLQKLFDEVGVEKSQIHNATHLVTILGNGCKGCIHKALSEIHNSTDIIFHPDDIGKFQREILLYGNFDSSPKLLTITGECF